MATFIKACLYCRREFEATDALANICSPDCRDRSFPPKTDGARSGLRKSGFKIDQSRIKVGGGKLNAARIDQGTWAIVKSCPRCGATVRGMRTYCSSACRRARRRKERRAMIRHGYVEPVSIAVLRRRDEERCRICGEPVDFSKRPPHPTAPTIDHVIALAKGGEHSYQNTQLAHLRCNMIKGAE